MPFIAVIGAGALGGALAHKLAARNRIDEVRLIDSASGVAQGKALDILQASPIEQFSTRVTAAESIAAAAGAVAVVIADPASGEGQHAGEAGLALLRQLTRTIDRTPIVCAGAMHRDLIARTVSELHVPPTRIVGSAAYALESALRALAAVEADGSGVDVSVRVVGVPPRLAVVAWEEGAIAGEPLTSRLPAHRIAALTARIPGLWPLGPYALASAGAQVAEAIAAGSRRRFSCFVSVESGALRGAVVALPVDIWPGGVASVSEPFLTRQERTMLENAAKSGA